MAIAFVDESRKAHAGRAVYIFGAVIFMDAEAVERARDAMLALLIPGEPKVHWYGAVDTYRSEIMAAVAGLDAIHLAVWHEMLPGDTDERSRRVALTHLVYQLQLLGVEQAVLESRQPRQDKNDLDIFRTGPLARGARRVRADHMPGRLEPALWVADALCGADGERLVGNDRTYVDQIAEHYDSISTRLAERL